MAGVNEIETVSMGEAAERLGLTIDEVFELVFDRELPSVAAPSGRRVIPVEALQAFQRERQSTASA